MSAQTPPRAAPDAGGAGALPPGWKRLHPVSPALRSWKLLVVLLLFYVQNRGRALVDGEGDGPGPVELFTAAAVLVVVVVLATAGGVASWWFSRYAVDDEAVRLHTGVLARQQRSARLDRVQAVDIVRPPIARVLGFAEVRVEVAGGSGSAIRLAYLRRADAEALQASLLDRAQQVGGAGGEGALPGGEDGQPAADPSVAPTATAGSSGVAAADAGTDPGAPGRAPSGREVLKVPLPRLLGSIALSTLPPFLAVVAATAVALVVTGSGATLYGTAPLLLGLGATVWRDLSRGGAWTVETSAAGLRLRHGLLERRTQSIPRGRVQAVRVEQPVLWRSTRWWRVEVNVAGYGLESGEGGSTRVVPVCSRAQVDELLALVLPVSIERADVAQGLTGVSEAGGTATSTETASISGEGSSGERPRWVCSPRRARLLDPLAWRRQGVLAAPEVLLVRRGRLSRTLDVVPHGRTQSLAVGRGPLQRRLRLTTLVVHSTPGPVSPVAPHLDAAAAATFLLAQAARAASAAAAERPSTLARPPAP